MGWGWYPHSQWALKCPKEGKLHSRMTSPLGQGPLLSLFLFFFTLYPHPSKPSTNIWWINEWILQIVKVLENCLCTSVTPGKGREEHRCQRQKGLHPLFKSRLPCYLSHLNQGAAALVYEGLIGEGIKDFFLVPLTCRKEEAFSSGFSLPPNISFFIN